MTRLSLRWLISLDLTQVKGKKQNPEVYAELDANYATLK